MIASGFAFSGLFIHHALDDWSASQVVTTLDSIAAPIEEVDFPTVTVCPEEYGPPNNWAFLETLLNSLTFQCNPSSFANVSLFPGCNGSEKLRRDYQALIKHFVNKFKQWVFKAGGKWPILSKDLDSVESVPYFIAELLANGTITRRYLTKLPYELFARFTSLHDVLGQYQEDRDAYCTSHACQEEVDFVDKFVQLIRLEEIDSCRADAFFFGSFLVNAVLVDQITHTFDAFRNIQDLEDGYLCQQTDLDKLLHGFFKSLGTGLGLNEDELVSIFDIPSILGVHNEDSSWNLPVSQTFLFTQCQLSQELRKGDFGVCVNFWNDWINNPSEVSNPCKNPTIASKCCNVWTSKFRKNLKAVMKVMRFASRRGKSGVDIASFLKPFNESNILNGYSMNKISQGAYEHAYSRDLNSMIPWCSWKKQGQTSNTYLPDDSCTMFDPVVTDMGVCHSFNAMPFVDFLHDSSYKGKLQYSGYFLESANFMILDSFVEAFQHDYPANKIILKGSGSGNNHAIDIILINTDYFKERKDIPKSFRVSITSSGNFFDAKDVSKVVHVGKQTIFSVKPMEVKPSAALKDLAIHERHCRFPYETVSAVERFKIYTQTACEFECKVIIAESICQCTPWFVPSHPNPDQHLPMCDFLGNGCFNKVFAKGHRCSCLPTCHDIQFSVNERINDISVEEVCKNKFAIESKLSQTLRMHFHGMITKLHHIESLLAINETLLERETQDISYVFCKNLVSNSLAKVSVRFENNKYIKTITDRKVSFTDKLATIGGTLGLFTGMSILSMIEMGYWILTYVPRSLSRMS